MCREMEELYHEGITFGEIKAKMEMTVSLAKEGMSIEKIAEIAKESVQMVPKWLEGSMNLAN